MLKKFTLLVIFLFFCACGSTFQVRPRQEVALSHADQKTSNGNVELQATLLSEDRAMEIFDGNLFLAGTIPIQITLTNQSQQPITFTEKDFSLSDSAGQFIKNIKAKDALESLFSYYKIRAYNPLSYEKTKANFLTHSLELQQALMPNESRSGLLYFKIKKEKPIPKGLELKLARKATVNNLTLKLN